MASGTLPAASAAGVVASAAAASSSTTPQRRPRARAVTFRLAPRPKLPLFSSKACGLNLCAQRSCAVPVKSQLVVGAPPDTTVAVNRTPDVPNGDDAEPPAKEAATSPMSDEAVSDFMNQVASLVKLVDSRDIVELQLKQQGCELVIRKEALPQPSPAASVVMAQHHGPPTVLQPQFLPPPPAAPTVSAPAVAGALQALPPTAATAAKPAKSSHPPLKSPMAGTFYRNPGPGQPPFVKVGDKVNKGQALCIIEAMKLMNEIEADQAGTIAEILVDDAKPVAVDQPLFMIEP